MSLSAVRHKEILSGLPAIARKVYDVIPIQDAWTANAIGSALQQQTRSSLQFRTLDGCIGRLRGAGLIYEPKPGCYQREPVRDAIQKPMKTNDMEPTRDVSAVDILSELATRARRLADDIEAAAEVIREQEATNAEAAGKLAQLQSIFKSL